MMKCLSCKCFDVMESTTTYMTEAEHCIVIIKNVPCIKCKQCGDVLYSTDILEKIDEIILSAEKLASEISVIDYTKVA